MVTSGLQFAYLHEKDDNQSLPFAGTSLHRNPTELASSACASTVGTFAAVPRVRFGVTFDLDGCKQESRSFEYLTDGRTYLFTSTFITSS